MEEILICSYSDVFCYNSQVFLVLEHTHCFTLLHEYYLHHNCNRNNVKTQKYQEPYILGGLHIILIFVLFRVMELEDDHASLPPREFTPNHPDHPANFM